MDWDEILVIVLAVLLFIVYIPFTLLFYLNRRIHPIRGRMPRVILLTNFCMVLLAIYYVFFLLQFFPCLLDIWASNLLSFCWLSIYAYRLVRILFSYEITKNIMELQNLENQKEWKQNWYTRHRNLLRPKAGFVIGLCVCLFYVISLTVATARDYLYTMSTCEEIGKLANTAQLIGALIGIVSELILVIFIVWLAIKIFKKHADGLYLRTEVLWTSGTSGVSIVIWIVSRSGKLDCWGNIFGLLALHVFFLAGTVWPYFLSRKEKRLRASSPSMTFDLCDIITTPEGFKAFLDYLQLEFSPENLLFWGDVLCLKTLINSTESKRLFDMYCELYCKFIVCGAPCQITLLSNLSQEITLTIQKGKNGSLPEILPILSQLFEQAQTEIYHLMKADSFLRFQQTQTYQQLKSILLPINRKGTVSEISLSIAERYARGTFDPVHKFTKSSIAAKTELEMTPTKEQSSIDDSLDLTPRSQGL